MSDIYLYVYDLSKGMAKQFSAMFLGKHFDGVWHTGIVAFGNEWYFGNGGIDCCPPKGTILGDPNEMIKLGQTQLSEDDFLEIVRQLAESSFKIGTYNLLEHNCNNFSNEIAKILVGKGIPQHIIDLPKEILNTSLGPMLRPLLEQAADPVHQLGSGHTPIFSKLNSLNLATNNGASTSSKNTQCTNETIPTTTIIYKTSIQNEIDIIKQYVQIQDTGLINEIKDYLKQAEVSWNLSNEHLKLLFNLYLTKIQSIEHKMIILKMFQLIALHSDMAMLITNNSMFIDSFLPSIKESQAPDIHYLSLQTLSNMCTHTIVCRRLLEKNQETLFKNLSDFTLIEPNTDTEQLVQESSLSFFYNLISAFHLESLLEESHALVLGVALLERLPKSKCKPKSIYHMLALFRSCLSKSKDIVELAQSLNFDSSPYKSEDTANKNTADSYESVIRNINDLIKPKDESH